MAHKLFLKQLARATDPAGEVNFELLCDLVSAAYDESDSDRRRTDRSISLMISEVEAHTEHLREREAQLQIQNTRFEAALDNMSQGLCLTDADHRIVVCNRQFAQLLRLPSELVTPGVSIFRVFEHCVESGVFPETSAKPTITRFTGYVTGRQPIVFQRRIAGDRTLQISGSPMQNGGWVGTYQDITEQHHAREELERGERAQRQQSQLLKDALDNLRHGLALYDSDLRLDIFNPRYLEIYGLKPSEVVQGMTFEEVRKVRQSKGHRIFTEDGRPLEDVFSAGSEQSGTAKSDDESIVVMNKRTIRVSRNPRKGGGWVVMYADITERREAQVALAVQNELFKDALDNMGYGLNVFDAQSRILVYNKQYLEMTGLTEADVPLGITARDIINRRKELGTFPESADDFATLHRNELRNNKFFEHRQYSALGRTIHSTFYPRNVGGWVVLHRDVTEQLKAETEKQAAAAEAERSRQQEQAARAANEAKSAFLAMMSHEIRTPMNAIIGLSSALLESGLSGEQLHLADTIFESSNGLLRLLNDVLDISKLDAGRVEFEAAPFSLAATIDHAVSIIKARATEKGLEVRAVIDEKIPAAVIGDQARVRQVILNLVTNSLKFTDAGVVEISARSLGSMDGKITIECAVRDTGIGIAHDKLGKLFTEFSQADATIHRRFGGTGLGLAICKRIVGQMGGDIRVESTPGVGTTFTFTLTFAATDVTELAQAPAVANYDDFTYMLASLDEPLAVLLAEDNATNQMVFTRLMQNLNVSISIAANGREALQLAQDRPFDVVFMDMRMPEMDGVDATRAIRALGGAWEYIPIVALTANAFADDVKACRDAGMNEFLAKPVRKKTLVETLAKVLVDHHPIAIDDDPYELAAVEGIPVTPPAEVAMTDVAPICDHAMLARLIEEIDHDGVRMTLDVFLSDTAQRLKLMHGLSLESDRLHIKDEAHTLKGASATFGLRQVFELSKTIEHAAPTIAAAELADLLDRLDASFAVARDELEAALTALASAA